jgi:hypothetical protein
VRMLADRNGVDEFTFWLIPCKRTGALLQDEVRRSSGNADRERKHCGDGQAHAAPIIYLSPGQ